LISRGPILSKADITFGQFEGVCTDRGILQPHLAKSLSLMDPRIGSTLKKGRFHGHVLCR